MAWTPGMVDSVNGFILADRRDTIVDISEQQGISLGTAHNILQDDHFFLRSLVAKFHRDNARTMETIWHFGWEQLSYPP